MRAVRGIHLDVVKAFPQLFDGEAGIYTQKIEVHSRLDFFAGKAFSAGLFIAVGRAKARSGDQMRERMFAAPVGSFNKKGTEISRTVQHFFYMLISVKGGKIDHCRAPFSVPILLHVYIIDFLHP